MSIEGTAAPEATAAPTGDAANSGAATGSQTDGGAPQGEASKGDVQAPTVKETPAGETPPGETKADGAERVLKAPEKYEWNLPEGADLNSETLGELATLAREFDLPQESAQKVADLGLKMLDDFATAQKTALDNAVKGWEAAVVADKEIGGDAYAENLAVTNKALEAFGTPALSTLLKETRMGSHPEVVRLLLRVGKAIGEDKLVTGGNGARAEAGTASVLYPNQKSKA